MEITTEKKKNTHKKKPPWLGGKTKQNQEAVRRKNGLDGEKLINTQKRVRQISV